MSRVLRRGWEAPQGVLRPEWLRLLSQKRELRQREVQIAGAPSQKAEESPDVPSRRGSHQRAAYTGPGSF